MTTPPSAGTELVISVSGVWFGSGAPVSVPVRWEDLDKVYPTDYTLHTVPDYLQDVGDLWHDILQHKNDLTKLMTNAQGATRRRRKS